MMIYCICIILFPFQSTLDWILYVPYRLILQKIQFTNAVTGELYPCDLDNQENAEPPYVEIRDKYNNT